jgi:23S rRNA (guanosine2251-2'-O)-methyltransferase
MKTEILYGYHPVLEAIRSNRRTVFEVYVSNEKRIGRLETIVNLASSSNVPVKRQPASWIQAMVKTASHQGICAKVGPYPLADLSEMLAKADDSDLFLLLLDNIVDPHNLGALIRTAFCVAADGVVIPKDRAAPPTPAVSKSSAGALEHVLLARVTNMTATIKTLKQQGVWVIGLDKDSEVNMFQSDLTGPLALVVGGEEHGIRPLVRQQCDGLISIPQSREVDSLNASAAGAVAMYEAFRQRRWAKSIDS